MICSDVMFNLFVNLDLFFKQSFLDRDIGFNLHASQNGFPILQKCGKVNLFATMGR